MEPLKITTIGNSVGVILPKEILAKLHVGKGDLLYVSETPDGIKLVPYEDNYAMQMDLAEKIMRKYRTVLKKLAE